MSPVAVMLHHIVLSPGPNMVSQQHLIIIVLTMTSAQVSTTHNTLPGVSPLCPGLSV